MTAEVTVSDENWSKINKALEIGEKAQADKDAYKRANEFLNKDNEKLRKINRNVHIITGVSFCVGVAVGSYLTVQLYKAVKKQ